MNSETDMTRSQFKLQLLICVGWVVEIYCNLIIFENGIETTINIWLQRKVVTRECLVTVKTEKWNSHTAIVHKAQEYLVKKSNLQRNLKMNNTISRCFILIFITSLPIFVIPICKILFFLSHSLTHSPPMGHCICWEERWHCQWSNYLIFICAINIRTIWIFLWYC